MFSQSRRVVTWPDLICEDIKPAGTQADETAVAAVAALLASRDSDFQDLAAAWCSAFLQLGQCFRRKADGAVFLSLGFQKWCSLGWRLEPVLDRRFPGGRQFFHTPPGLQAEDARGRLEFLRCSNLAAGEDDRGEEEFEGIPCEFCL